MEWTVITCAVFCCLFTAATTAPSSITSSNELNKASSNITSTSSTVITSSTTFTTSVSLSTTPAYKSYKCPPECHCGTVSTTELDRIQLVCSVDYIQNETAFDVIPGPMTVWITLHCKPHFISEIAERALHHLRHLEELIISGCALEELPANLLQTLTNLRLLNIESSAFLKVPEKFFSSTPMLEELILVGFMSHLPQGELCKLKQLRTLNFTDNLFEQLENLGINQDNCSFPELESLSLSENKLLCWDIPLQRIAPNLKVLNVSQNSLARFDGAVLWEGMEHLQYLDVRHNQITTLGDPSPNLQVALLSRNKLKEMNSSWCQGQMLQLDASFNQIANLGTDFCANAISIQGLFLGHNKLSNLASNVFFGCSRLLALDLSGNLLQELQHEQFKNQNSLLNLNLSGNQLSELSADTFEGLHSLTTLDISHNKLEEINGSVWGSLPSLHSLYMSDNALTVVPEGLGQLTQLHTLELRNNNLKVFLPGAFIGLDNLEFLVLKGHSFRYLPHSAFAATPNLKLINLANNEIANVEYGTFVGVPKLTYLNLNHNKISDITASFLILKQLKVLWLKGNKLTRVETGMFSSSLQEINLSDNQIAVITPNAFLNLPALTLVDLRTNRLEKIVSSALAVASNALVQFYISINLFSCECDTTFLKDFNTRASQTARIGDYDSLLCKVHNGSIKFIHKLANTEFLCDYDRDCTGDGACSCCNSDIILCPCRVYCPDNCTCITDLPRDYSQVNCSGHGSLDLFHMPERFPASTKILILSGQDLGNLHKDQFASSPHLQNLILSNTFLHGIGEKAFRELVSLQVLDLSYNQLTFIEPGTFASLSSLQTLDLRHNELSSLNLDNLFGDSNMLESVYLAWNPWECSCESGPHFRDMLVRQSQILSDVNDLLCSDLDPDLILGNLTESSTPVLSVPFDKCLNSSVLTYSLSKGQIAAFTVSIIVLILLFVLVMLIIYFRKFIQVWLFSKYGIRLRLQKTTNTPKTYDAFISFSQHDLQFVLNELMPKLECPELSYRLCIHYRDWPVGEVIAVNVANSVAESHRTILLLSDNFLASEWCNYEFQAAHQRVLQDRSAHLIVVLLQDEPPEGLDEELSLYIKTHTYLKRSDPYFWHKLVLALPEYSKEEVLERQRTGTEMQRLLEHQRIAMEKLNYKFQDGTVVVC